MVVLSEFNLSWPSEVKDTTDWLSVTNFNLEIAAPECEVPDLGCGRCWTNHISCPYCLTCTRLCRFSLCFCIVDAHRYTNKLTIYLLAPVLCVVCLILVAMCASCWDCIKSRRVHQRSRPDDPEPEPQSSAVALPEGAASGAPAKMSLSVQRVVAAQRVAAMGKPLDLKAAWKKAGNVERCIVATLTLLKVYYLGVSSQVFGFFDCTQHASGVSTLDADPSLLCDDAWWDAWRPGMVGAVFLYVVRSPTQNASSWTWVCVCGCGRGCGWVGGWLCEIAAACVCILFVWRLVDRSCAGRPARAEKASEGEFSKF